MGENHSRVARRLQKEILFCPIGGFQILQDISSRTCIHFSNSATGRKTPTRSGALMPNCLWPVTSICGSISTWLWDAPILLVSSEGNLPSSGQPQPLLAFSWLDPVSAAQGPTSLKELIACSKMLLGPHCPQSLIFHYCLSRFQYFLSCSPLLTNILFYSNKKGFFFPLSLEVIPGQEEKCDSPFGKLYMEEGCAHISAY